MATSMTPPSKRELWHLSIDAFLGPLPETFRLGGPGPFVINLRTSSTSMNPIPNVLRGFEDLQLFQIQRIEDDALRFRLRLGPFTSEEVADAVLLKVRDSYPCALTATATADDLQAIESLKKPKSQVVHPIPARAATPAAEPVGLLARVTAAEPAGVSAGVPGMMTATSAASGAAVPAAHKAASAASASPATPAVATRAAAPPATPAVANRASVSPAIPAVAARASASPATPAIAARASASPATPAVAAHASASPATPAVAAHAVAPPTTPSIAATSATAEEPKRVPAPLQIALSNVYRENPSDSAQMIRRLTPPESNADQTLRWFVIELALTDHAIDPETVPNLDIYGLYRLYSVTELNQGRCMHALRLGFFSEEIAAKAVSSYLAAYYEKPTIKRVSSAERQRFSEQGIEARKDVGAFGMHAAIEITADRLARPVRKSVTPPP